MIRWLPLRVKAMDLVMLLFVTMVDYFNREGNLFQSGEFDR